MSRISVLLFSSCLAACSAGAAAAPAASATRHSEAALALFERGQDLFVLEHGENVDKPAFVPTGVLPACLEAIRIHGHELPPSVYAAAKRKQR